MEAGSVRLARTPRALPLRGDELDRVAAPLPDLEALGRFAAN
jgi:hypothetical protein